MSEIKSVLDEGLKACEELFERDYFGNHNVQIATLAEIRERFNKANLAYEALNGKYHELKARSEIEARTTESLQKENEILKGELYGQKEINKAQFNICKRNAEEAKKLLNEAYDENAAQAKELESLRNHLR